MFQVWLWLENSGECQHVKTLQCHTDAVTHLASLPAAICNRLQAMCYSLGQDASLILYSLSPPEVVHVMGGHSAPIKSLHWDLEEDHCYALCADGALYVWHWPTGRLERQYGGRDTKDVLQRLGHRGIASALAVPDGFPVPGSAARGLLHCLHWAHDEHTLRCPVVLIDVEALLEILHSSVTAEAAPPHSCVPGSPLTGVSSQASAGSLGSAVAHVSVGCGQAAMTRQHAQWDEVHGGHEGAPDNAGEAPEGVELVRPEWVLSPQVCRCVGFLWGTGWSQSSLSFATI